MLWYNLIKTIIMKLLKMLILLSIITTFSCSKDSEDNEELPAQGNVSLALSNGAGFVVENLVATISNQYDSANTSTITISGTSGSSGTVTITIVDNDNSFKALANGTDFTIGDTAQSFYATVEYQSDNFNLSGGAGTLKIINYTESNSQNYSEISATFSAAGPNFNTITSSILDLILDCTGC